MLWITIFPAGPSNERQAHGADTVEAQLQPVPIVEDKTRVYTLDLTSQVSVAGPNGVAEPLSTDQRLAQAYAILQRLEFEREAEQHQSLGKLVEERIIWRELLDLELQEIDERIERISVRAAEYERARA